MSSGLAFELFAPGHGKRLDDSPLHLVNSSPMLRSELIDTLHEENPHLTRREVERVVAVVLETVTQTLEAGARVELRGFGAFSVRHRKARPGRNPRTGEPVSVPEKHVPFFRTGKDLRERIDASR